MRIIADVKCYHCGHISGSLEGDSNTPVPKYEFQPRPGYQGTPPGPGDKIHCERCRGPVFLEDVRPAVTPMATFVVPAPELKRPRRKAS